VGSGKKTKGLRIKGSKVKERIEESLVSLLFLVR
jgi:hypothetical protein